MREFDQIAKLWAQSEQAGEAAVLATVVKTQGSSYRLPGARLLITARGQRAGSVSGGCLEDDLVKKAWWLTDGNQRVIRRYDTTSDGEIVPQFGLGCSGIIHVLLERLTPGNAQVLDLLESVREYRRPAAMAHIIQPQALTGQRLILDAQGQTSHDIADTDLAALLETMAAEILEARQSRNIILPNGVETFVEVVTPPVRLLVFGAGDDAIPVTQLAKYLGWSVSVFDGRSHYARRERFPQADEVTVREAGGSDTAIDTDSWTVAVLMSHSYSQDLEMLRELSSWPLAYLGILGPRKRTAQLLADAELDASGLTGTLHSPMGLDIGADGPEQVALAVIAEIQATLNGRDGGLLRERSGSIHAKEDDAGEAESVWVRSIACA
jgi:xanthine dehydrogenase accessory factor